ncbi:cupin domain-containing protein [uncultured Albimonas sp.]|uniref:cupin domain-containing protein n=1 Tax=uncultured Albimonas sp. TaxID=1331701 RepID=UPI0030EC89EE|tara:strand:- start:1972 stop:2328 length:357 start_codon:yes stop_codon:yes gene_type:complete
MQGLKTVFAEMPGQAPVPGAILRRVTGEQAMIQHAIVAKGLSLPPHSHPNEQFTLVILGRLRLSVGEPGETTVYEVGPGDLLRLPGGVPHAIEALEDSVAVDVFAPPSQTTGLDAPGG